MTLADALGVGHALTFEGKTYTLRKPTLYEQGLFQRWLEQRAHDAVERGTEPEEKKDRRHNAIYRDSALGYYEWDGPCAMEALWTPAGLAQIVAIVCREQGVDDELAERIVAEQIKRVAAIILGRASSDPLAMAPVLEALGFPIDWLRFEPSAPSSSNSATRPSEPSPTSKSSADSPTSSSCSATPSSAAPTE
jgi:hypothetical protein